jgi:hypothetical protein
VLIKLPVLLNIPIKELFLHTLHICFILILNRGPTGSFNLKGKLPDDIQFSGVEFRDMRRDLEEIVTIEFSPQGWIEPVTVYLASSQGRKMSIIMHEMLGYIETLEVIE